MKCRFCGKEIDADSKFCSFCGKALSNGGSNCGNSNTSLGGAPQFNLNQAASMGEFLKAKFLNYWNKLDLFFKVVFVLGCVTAVLFVSAWGTGNPSAMGLSWCQVILLVISSCMYTGKIRPGKSWVKYVLLVCVGLLICPNVKAHITHRFSKLHLENEKPETAPYGTDDDEDLILCPIDSDECAGMDYIELEKIFRNAGFSEIIDGAEEDLEKEESDKAGTVKSVVVDGSDTFVKDQKYGKDALVLVMYHKLKKQKVSVQVNFPTNLIFSKYGVEVYVDDQLECELSHGESGDFELMLDQGEHRIEFVGTEDNCDAKGEALFRIEGETNISYTIHCREDDIDVNLDYIEDRGTVSANEIMMPCRAADYRYENYQTVEAGLRELGFSNIERMVLYDIHYGITDEGETDSVSIDGNSNFNRGDVFANDSKVVIIYHLSEDKDPNRQVENADERLSEKQSSSTSTKTVTAGKHTSKTVSYTSNSWEDAKQGNKGVYSYIKIAPNYDLYYIIDFDEGYIYHFTLGNEELGCDKVKILSGDLNDHIIVEYNDSGSKWKESFHFKRQYQPNILIAEDKDGYEDEYIETNLKDALIIRSERKIHEY